MTLRIVMPVLDEGEGLARRLRALAPLRRRGAELVVVDGGSTDATWAVACAHADRVLLAPRGRGAQMNAGARGSTCRTLLFLHADTQLPEGADTLIEEVLARGALWGRFDVRIDSARPLLRVVERMMNLRSRLTGIATGDQAIFVRRDLFQALGGFAELALMEDVELSRRLKERGAPACLRHRVLTSGRRWDKHGAVRTIALMWRLRAAFFLGADAAALARRYGYDAAPPDAPRTGVAIMARAPQPGQAKTRLVPALGASGAARAQRRFTLATLHTVQAARIGPMRLWCAPDAGHRFFKALERLRGIHGMAQPQGDLGARMQHAFARHFEVQRRLPMLLVGTDCPLLAPAHLQQAARALADHEVVLIPAEDGGYVLIGMQSLIPALFEDIEWSTPRVLAQTREQLRQCGVTWAELPALWDVDEPADWQRLQQLENPDG